MKKILAFVAIALVTASVQAATVDWQSGNLMTPGADGIFSSTKIPNKSVTGYVILLDSATFGTVSSTLAGQDGSLAVWNQYKDSLSSAAASKQSNAFGKVSGMTAGDFTADGGTAYGLVIFTYGGDAGSNAEWAILNAVKGVVAPGQTANTVVRDIGSSVGKWTAVPEPTTAALLALGLAAFGLKRKVRK